jgi:histidyl-tRNA synthetase
LKHANRLGARTVAIVGAEDRAAGTYTLRDMRTGDERREAMREIVRLVAEVHAT